ncbi:MAG: hybrid sensor histidine kinase/response regulator [Caldilinea sp.]
MHHVARLFDDHRLHLFHLDLIQKLTTFLLVFCCLTPWALLPRTPYPYATLPYFLGLAVVAAFAKLYAGRGRLSIARSVLVVGISTIYTWAVLQLQIAWLPYLSIPVMSIVGLLAGYGPSLLLGALLLLAVGAVNLQAPIYPAWELIFVMSTGFAINLLTLGTLTTAVTWYKASQDRSDELLSLTREHRAELAQAFKSLQISNVLLQKTQQELSVARKQAEHARQMKEQFAANISHELRTPLNLILGFGKIMHLSPEVYGELAWPPTLRHDVYQVFRNSQHLSELIDDILDLSHFEMTGYTLRRELVSMTHFLRESVGILTNLFRESPVLLTAGIPDDLPEIEIDATRIRQVLINLVTNAYRHTTAGCVAIDVQHHPHEVEISVRDTGAGISADKLEYIFEQFYQVDTSLHRKHGGVGIGLTLSKQFVESHGGRIWAQSTVGVGSTFCFSLPITTALALTARSDDYLDAFTPPHSLPSILIFDRDGWLYRTARRRIDGYHWIQVSDWDALMAQVQVQQPRAVVLNLAPEENAPPLLQDLKIPIISCSFQVQLSAGETAPFRKLLLKPLDIALLTEEINALGVVNEMLVIDDDRAFIQLVQRMMAIIDPAVSVRHAYEVTEGLALLAESVPDLILADVVMPEAGGVDLIEQMRHEGRYLHVPVILLTAGEHEHTYFNRYGTTLALQRASGLTPNSVLKYLGALLAEVGPNPDL